MFWYYSLIWKNFWCHSLICKFLRELLNISLKQSLFETWDNCLGIFQKVNPYGLSTWNLTGNHAVLVVFSLSLESLLRKSEKNCCRKVLRFISFLTREIFLLIVWLNHRNVLRAIISCIVEAIMNPCRKFWAYSKFLQ